MRLPTILQQIRSPIVSQRRWAQSHDVCFIVTRRSHSIINKYHDKLAAKAMAEGHASVDDLRQAYRDRIDEVKRRHKVQLPGEKLQTSYTQSDSSVGINSSRGIGADSGIRANESGAGAVKSPVNLPSSTGVKSLPQILNLEKVVDLPVLELSTIWRLRHSKNPSSLSAVIPAATYQAMESLGKRCPQFVLPIPRNIDSDEAAQAIDPPARPGAEIHFLQWTFDPPSKTSTVLFTHLAEYKLKGEFATPHTTITHHLDLFESKSIVLMQGTVMDGRGMTPDDGRWLVMCLQRFYGGWGDLTQGKQAASVERAIQRRLLLESFSKGDPSFSLEKLLDEVERMG